MSSCMWIYSKPYFSLVFGSLHKNLKCVTRLELMHFVVLLIKHNLHYLQLLHAPSKRLPRYYISSKRFHCMNMVYFFPPKQLLEILLKIFIDHFLLFLNKNQSSIWTQNCLISSELLSCIWLYNFINIYVCKFFRVHLWMTSHRYT